MKTLLVGELELLQLLVSLDNFNQVGRFILGYAGKVLINLIGWQSHELSSYWLKEKSLLLSQPFFSP